MLQHEQDTYLICVLRKFVYVTICHSLFHVFVVASLVTGYLNSDAY